MPISNSDDDLSFMDLIVKLKREGRFDEMDYVGELVITALYLL
jgi:hypothetical protein